MDARYDLLKKGRARNIKEYNAKYRRREAESRNGLKFPIHHPGDRRIC